MEGKAQGIISRVLYIPLKSFTRFKARAAVKPTNICPNKENTVHFKEFKKAAQNLGSLRISL